MSSFAEDSSTEQKGFNWEKHQSDYQGPKPITEQVEFLAKEFKLSLNETNEFIEKVLPTLKLPKGAEGWFAIPSVDAIANRFFPGTTNLAERYCHAVHLVLEKISNYQKVYTCHSGPITPSNFRQHERTLQSLSLIAEQQKSEILIVPAQFGIHHQGRSVRQARDSFTDNEFGLGAFAVGCMLLNHPERSSLWMLITDCAGDEFSPHNDENFLSTRLFGFSEGRIRFSSCYVDNAGSRRGSASGFIPQ